MKKTLLTKFVLMVSLLFAMSASSVFAAASLNGLFLVTIDGNPVWVRGTLYGASINIEDGFATATPPAALVLEGGGGAVSYNNPIVIRYKPIPPSKVADISSENMQSENMQSEDMQSFMLEKNILLNGDGMSIHSKLPFDMKIYDTSGRLIYSDTNQKDININSSMLGENGHYVLYFSDSTGKTSTMNLLVVNGEISLGTKTP